MVEQGGEKGWANYERLRTHTNWENAGKVEKGKVRGGKSGEMLRKIDEG